MNKIKITSDNERKRNFCYGAQLNNVQKGNFHRKTLKHFSWRKNYGADLMEDFRNNDNVVKYCS